MYSKDYFLNVLRTGFIHQIDIPTYLIQDNDIEEIINRNNWVIQSKTNTWVTLIKMKQHID